MCYTMFRKCIYFTALCTDITYLPFVMVFRSIIVIIIIEPVREISNNMVCATSKASDHPAHTRSLIRAFASRFSIL